MADSLSVSALVVALIGAGWGIAAAFIAARAQQRVVRLTASLGEQRAESDARRSYEYEARKRLYNVYEPLRVRLLDCTDKCRAADRGSRRAAGAWPPWVQLG